MDFSGIGTYFVIPTGTGSFDYVEVKVPYSYLIDEDASVVSDTFAMSGLWITA